MRLMKRIHPAALLLAFVLVVYFVSASWGIENPGIEYDEILFGNAAMGIQDHSFIFWAADVGGKRLPIMLMSYIGALKAYLFFPIARFVGFDPLSIRLPGILIGALSLLLYTAFARRAVGLRGALLFALLLATDPSYLYHTRLDWGPVVLMLFMKAAGALLFLRWWESNRLRELAASGLLLGLGVFDKVNFLWFLIAAVLALLLVYGGELLHRVSPVNILTFSLSCVLGALPVLLYNVAYPLATLREPFEASPGSLLTNGALKLQVVAETLLGTAVFRFVNSQDVWPLWDTFIPTASADGGGVASVGDLLTWTPFGRGTLLVPALAVCVLFISLRSASHHFRFARPALCLTLVMVFIVAQLLITNQATGSYHVMMLYPIPQLLVVMALVSLWPTLQGVQSAGVRKSLLPVLGVWAVVVAMVGSNLLIDAGYLRYFAAEGGKGIWSSAVYDLVDYAKEKPSSRFVLMDWGFNTQLLALSRGSIKKDEVFHWLADRPAEREQFDVLLKDPNSLFLFHSDEYTKFPAPKQLFAKILDEKGLKEEQVKLFYQKNGEPVYYLSRVVPAASPISQSDLGTP